MASAPDLSLRGGRRPTWQSREGTYSSYRLPIKRHAPIASVAALSERHAGWQHVPYFFCGARPPDLSLRGGRRPTWRPEREARGSALGVQSREGTCSSYRLTIKTYKPIASVAALTERLAHLQVLRYKFIGARPPSLSFRGAKRRGNLAVPAGSWESYRQNRNCLPEIATGAKRPRNDTSGKCLGAPAPSCH